VRNGVVGLGGCALVGGRPLQNTNRIMVGASQDGLESHLEGAADCSWQSVAFPRAEHETSFHRGVNG
jgi:hypothetical protein